MIKHSTHSSSITASEIVEALQSGEEIAILDVRPHADFVAGHILRSVPLALGQIESQAGQILPRKNVPIVIVGKADGIAERAVSRLARLDYSNVSLLAGGIEGWRGSGREIISGQHALSKALGEYVERVVHTPRLTVEDLQRRRDRGEKIVVLDTRPSEEFEYVAIPDSIAAPGVELVYRFDEVVDSEDTTVVVTCAGRTRGIIGAQALINAGIKNPVYSLENGTSGWQFAGFEPQYGASTYAPPPSSANLKRAAERADALEKKFDIARISPAQLASFQDQAAERTLYIFDVRSVEEYRKGHIAGSRSAPGGQLVQTTDLFIAVNNSRVVLVDGQDGVRGAITASWLAQIGLAEVYVYRASSDVLSGTGDEAMELPPLRNGVYVSAEDIAARTAELTIIDFGSFLSGQAARRVVDGSWYATRESLPTTVDELPGDGAVLFVSEDGLDAAFATDDIAPVGGRELLVLKGGKIAWEKAGLPLLDIAHPHSLDVNGPPNPVLSLERRKEFFDNYVAWGDTIIDKIRAEGTINLGNAS